MIHVENMLDVRLASGLGSCWHGRETTASIHEYGTADGAAFDAPARALSQSVVLA
jgi:hypothetical protein